MGVVIIQMARSSIQPEPLSAGLRRGARRGFTLLELLVVVAIIAMLVAILVSTVVKVRGSTRGFVCKNNLKTVAFDFLQFADEYAHPYRGDSERFGRSSFDLEDFQERVYGIAEFWKVSGLTEAAYEPSKQPLMCPGGPNPLKKQAGVPCRDYAVTPAANVSVALNMRLYRASVLLGGRPVLHPVQLTPRLQEHPAVPVAFDVDGAAAAKRGILPYYSAPPAGAAADLYGSGRFWFPASRHAGQVNACFVGGYVLSARKPAAAPGWDWRHQPPPQP